MEIECRVWKKCVISVSVCVVCESDSLLRFFCFEMLLSVVVLFLDVRIM